MAKFARPLGRLTPRSILREFYELSADFLRIAKASSPALNRKRPVAEKYTARRFSGIQQSSGAAELDDLRWPPGLENPAHGLAKEKRYMAARLPFSGIGYL